jgi:formylglycine-generating enzyme required for sulfatase activity
VKTTIIPMQRRSLAALTVLALATAGVFAAGRLTGVIRPEVSATTQAKERAATPPGMVYVPGGDFYQGSDDPDADPEVKPRHSVFVPSYYIDRTEVTNREFKRFRPDFVYPLGEDNFPATNIIYDDAAAFAKWACKEIPTPEQWEKAARGTDGRRFPWGDTWDKSRVAARAKTLGVPAPKLPESAPQQKVAGCRLGPTRVQPVGSNLTGASPYGALDMAGNAWEWVQGYYLNNPNQRVLRGGAVGYGERANRTYERAVEGSQTTCRDTGFRCAKAVNGI